MRSLLNIASSSGARMTRRGAAIMSEIRSAEALIILYLIQPSYLVLNSTAFGIPQSQERMFLVESRDIEDISDLGSMEKYDRFTNLKNTVNYQQR